MIKINLLNQVSEHCKSLILTLLLGLMAGYCFSQEIINRSQLVEKDNIIYFSDKPFTGKCATYFDSGKIGIEGNYKNGRKDGEWIWYYENGTRKRSTIFKDGIKSENQFTGTRQASRSQK